MRKFAIFVLLLIVSGCNESKPQKSYDAKALLQSKCASCHNLELPPKISKDELAPPMMAVSHHIVTQIKVQDESQRVRKSVMFVKDYVINPDISKSFCDKESLKSYGVMPSQKANVTPDELEAIASYMFRHYTQKNLTMAQETLNRFNAMSEGEKLARKHNCFGCHQIDKDMVGPSFKSIAHRYKGKSTQVIKDSIAQGSKGKYKTAIMPPFKNVKESELETISKWIMKR